MAETPSTSAAWEPSDVQLRNLGRHALDVAAAYRDTGDVAGLTRFADDLIFSLRFHQQRGNVFDRQEATS